VQFGDHEPYGAAWVEAYAADLASLGGTAGFVAEEAPDGWAPVDVVDAFLLSLDNTIE
jgi:hypothetical protein